MNNALLFAQVFGPLFILLWISMIINRKWFMKLFKEIQDSYLAIFIFSIVWFIGWMYILANFSGNADQYEIFATFIGILITLKSTFYILTPWAMKKIMKQMKPVIKKIHYIWAVYMFLWIYVSYIAYV